MNDGPEPLNKCENDVALTLYGPSGPAWEFYVRWLSWWRSRHPDDGRDDYELSEEFGRWAGWWR